MKNEGIPGAMPRQDNAKTHPIDLEALVMKFQDIQTRYAFDAPSDRNTMRIALEAIDALGFKVVPKSAPF